MKPGRELDALVAEKVMGWKKVMFHGLPIWSNPKHQGYPIIIPAGSNIHPPYSTDIGAAWEVVQSIKSMSSEPYADPWNRFCIEFADLNDDFGAALWNVNPKTICMAALETVLDPCRHGRSSKDPVFCPQCMEIAKRREPDPKDVIK